MRKLHEKTDQILKNNYHFCKKEKIQAQKCILMNVRKKKIQAQNTTNPSKFGNLASNMHVSTCCETKTKTKGKAKMKKCIICEADDDLHVVNDRVYCRNCALKEHHLDRLQKCAFCGHYSVVTDGFELIDLAQTTDMLGRACRSCYDNLVECQECGKHLKSDDAIEHENKLYCNSCAFVCGECGEVHVEPSVMHWTADKVWLCECCHNSYYTECCECFESVVNDEVIYHEDTAYCETCFEQHFVECCECLEVVDIDVSSSHLGEIYCETCFHECFVLCCECGEALRADGYDSPYRDSNGDYLCCHCRPNGAIQSYHCNQRRHLTFIGNPSDNMFFGIEVEIENEENYIDNEDMAQNIIDEHGWLYCESDASIDDGFEIVSHPISWSKLKSQYLNKYACLLETLKEEGFRSFNTTTCGIHIHISRKAISRIQLYKYLRLIYANLDQVGIISQRTKHNSPGSCAWEKGKETNRSKDKHTHIKKAISDTYSGRYTAVNCENRKTIETRIFKGTLCFESFCKNLEFVRSAMLYCNTVGLSDVAWNTYKAYVFTQKKEYPNLTEFIRRKQI